MDRPIFFGLETEYGFTPLGPDGELLDRAQVAGELMEIVRARSMHIRDVASLGIFLSNGSRLYIDRGIHPEVSTPECTDPWQIVGYARAGEKVIADAAHELEVHWPGSRILLFACNVDYSGSGETWGCHESYLHTGDNRYIAQALAPHFASRIIYTGGGGFDNRRPDLMFLLSPRSSHLAGDISGVRWLVSKRDEPLCVGFRRLHVVAGESQRSAIGTWLRVGVTALLVRMIEEGIDCSLSLMLADPIAALSALSRDSSCRRKVMLADGRELSAIEIQERYLCAAEDQIGRPFMPSWAAEVCRRWRSMLERLREGPDAVGTTLDWAIKRAIFKRHLTLRGLGSDERALHFDLRPGDPWDHLRVSPEDFSTQFNEGDAEAYGNARRELYEIDTRFGQLGQGGIFGALLQAGVLSDHVDGVSSVEEALENPPPIGRAALRGALVQRLGTRRRTARHLCDWEGVIDRQTACFADFRDPYEAEIRWKPIQEGSREWLEDGLVAEIVQEASEPPDWFQGDKEHGDEPRTHLLW